MSDEYKNTEPSSEKAAVVRKIFIYILIAAVILLPTFFAVIHVIYDDADVTTISERATEVVMYDANEVRLYGEHTSEGHSGDGSLISIFNTIYNAMEPVDSIPEDVLSVDPFLVDITRSDGVHTLRCYFTFTEGFSYCSDSQGNSYRIKTSDSERFLRSKFAELLYAEAVPPQMHTLDGEEIVSRTNEWYYRSIDQKYLLAEKVPTDGGEGALYNLTGGIAFSFDVAPDSTTATVYDGDTMIFSGNADELDTLILDSAASVNVKMSATWDKADDRLFYGNVNYDFYIAVYNRAEFAISKTRISQGEFAVLSATNITDISKLNFTCDLKEYMPFPILQNTTAYIIIPHTEANDLDAVSCKISYGVSSAEFSLKLTPNSLEPGIIRDTADILNFNYDSGTLSSEYLFLSGKSEAPNDTHFTRSVKYAEIFMYGHTGIYSCFTEYTCAYSADVSSVGSGMVAALGHSDKLGNYAVVDIGAGLRLWYCNMSAVDVRVGQYVCVGDIIGKTGKVFSDADEGFSLILAAGNVILNSEFLFV